ncbi:MAG: hypothetical protein LUF00_00085 [Lachnospiraceae bacterium]|nr:hypothetical protein [Lachnospiraceae bacterium]
MKRKDRISNPCPTRTQRQTGKIARVLMVAVLFCFLLLVGAPEVQAAVSKPVVLTETVNNYTTKVQVYSAKNTTVYVYNGSTKIASQKYSSAGVKTITISKQKAGSTLKFKAKDSSGTSSSKVSVKVEKLTSVKASSSLKKPTVSTKTIKSTTTKIKVKGYKGTKVVILNDAGEKVKTVFFTKTCTKTVTISKQTDTSCLYFYSYKNGKRSEIVKKTVTDATKPSKAKVAIKSATSILVKGEIGTAVYVKSGTDSKYTKKGYITSSSGLKVSSVIATTEGKYYVKLKDAAGNTSSATSKASSYVIKSGDYTQKAGSSSTAKAMATSYSMKEGKTGYLCLTAKTNGTRSTSTITAAAKVRTFKWSSSDTDVVTVSTASGKNQTSNTITAKAAGTATVTCKVDGVTFTWKITVKENSSSTTSGSSSSSSSSSSTETSGSSSSSGTSTENSNSTGSTGSTTTTTTEPVYDYEITLLNSEQYTLYSGDHSMNQLIYYIKTDNPDLGQSRYSSPQSYLSYASDASLTILEYDDITYTDPIYEQGYISSFMAVTGGYVVVIEYETAGDKTLTVTENFTSRIQVASYTVTVQDGDAAEEVWFTEVLNSVTDDSMTNRQKINAVASYVMDYFVYLPAKGVSGSSATLVILTSHAGAWWETKEIDCGGATYIMETFAEMLGMEHSTGTSGTAHEYAIIVDDLTGESFNVDVSPVASSNIITEWDMVI